MIRGRGFFSEEGLTPLLDAPPICAEEMLNTPFEPKEEEELVKIEA